VLVFSIEELLQYEKEHQNESLFVIAKFPEDALAIMESGVTIESVNVGNAAPIAGTKYVMVTRVNACTKENAAVYRRIAELNGGELTSQIMPSMETVNFLNALKKGGFD